MKSRLAVYGALKKTYSRHAEFLLNAQWLGNCWIANYALKDEGMWPMAFYAENFECQAEVYEVEDEVLTKIDILENVRSGYYVRDKVDTPYGKAGIYCLRVTKMVTNVDKWFSDGVWLGQNTKRSVWLGWEKERNIRERLLNDGFPPVHPMSPRNLQQHPVIGHSSNVATAEMNYSELEGALERSIIIAPREPDANEMRGRTRSMLAQFHPKMKVVEL